MARRLRPGDHCIALDERGESLSSRRFASRLLDLKDRGTPVRFLVGGAHGLGREALEACRSRLSLSPMTMPHEMAALVLSEQIYRAYCVWAHKDYAK